MVAFNTQASHLTLEIPETKEWDAIDSTLQPREKGCGFYQESDESRGDVAFINDLDLLRIYIWSLFSSGLIPEQTFFSNGYSAGVRLNRLHGKFLF